MNNESPVVAMETMLRVCLDRFDSTASSKMETQAVFSAPENADPERYASDCAACATFLCEAGLEQRQPLLLKRLTTFFQCVEPLLPEIEDALDTLKEAFLTLLRLRMAEADLDTDTRLVLGLDGAGRLEVADTSHPKAAELEAILERTPELGVAMREIARQSTLLRGLQDIGAVVRSASQDEAPPPVVSLGVAPYHVCLCGALSHFYF